MHYTGTIWRPPYEATSLLLEVTAGCTHHKCKFCTLYADLPFKFKMSPISNVEADLKEAQLHYGRLNYKVTRTFLTGANPFVLSFDKLLTIADLIHKYFPENETIGCFARIIDITSKSDKELSMLHDLGFDGLTIGIETGDDEALKFMNKGYVSSDIVTQCQRLDKVGIRYSFFYLTGISGAGFGELGARLTSDICNKLHPTMIGANMLTVYPNSVLYQELQNGTWREENEIEKYKELWVLLNDLTIPTIFAALGASNAVQLQGTLPKDKNKLLSILDNIISSADEAELQNYRKNLRHL